MSADSNKSFSNDSFFELEKTKTVTVESHTVFTTHRKKPKTSIDICRKGSIVKERCKQLCTVIADMFPSRIISDADLTCLLQDYIGGDKETIRAYKGYGGHVRAGRCGDNRIVGLSRKGYLELYGFLVKAPGRKWALAQTVLSTSEKVEPQTFYQTSRSPDSGFGSNQKISFSVVGMGGGLGESFVGGEVVSSREREKKETTEKERNLCPKIYPKIEERPSLSAVELAVLGARPCEEPDRSKTNFRERS